MSPTEIEPDYEPNEPDEAETMPETEPEPEVGPEAEPGADKPEPPKIKRYKNVSRSDFPDDFLQRPDEVLAEIDKGCKETIFKVDPELVSTHHDWVVRVELDPENTVPVTDVGVAQIGRWAEFRGVVQRTNHPKPRPLSKARACADRGNVIDVASGPGREPTRASPPI